MSLPRTLQESGAAIRRKVLPYGLSVPVVVVTLAILAFPLGYAAYGSMLHDDLLEVDSTFIGLDNYSALFDDPAFWSALRRSGAFVVATAVFGLILAVLFAFALTRAIGKLRLIRGLTITPFVVSGVAVGVMFRIFFNTDSGFPSQVLQFFGLEPVSWLGEPTLAMVSIVGAQIWGDLPLPILLILGGIQTIDSSLLDAASIDGATGWARARLITLPLVVPQLVLSLVFLSFAAFTNLGTILTLTGGGPGMATQTLPLEMYDVAFEQLERGRAMAIAMIMFLLNAVLAGVLLRVQRRYAT